MSSKQIVLDEALHAYLMRDGVREHPELARLRAITDEHPAAVMRTAAEQVQFLGFLLRLIGARRVVEVGVFTGYGTLGMALALPEGGQIHALDISAEYPAIGQPHWRRAGVSGRIDLRIGAAAQGLQALLAEHGPGSVDLMYVDADKEGYAGYVEAGARLVRPGGLIALDNVLWSGRVADPANADADTLELRALNTALHGDERFDLAMLPIADGLTLLRVR